MIYYITSTICGALVALMIFFFFRTRDSVGSIPTTKQWMPWAATVEFVDNRLQFALSQFVKHGNVFKARIYGTVTVFIGGQLAVRLLTDPSAAKSTFRVFSIFNRTPSGLPGRPAPMIVSEAVEDQHDLKQKLFKSALIKICAQPTFFGEKLPALFTFHFNKIAETGGNVVGVDLCKSIFWDLCVNILFSDVEKKGNFTSAVLSWILSCHRTQLDVIKCTLYKTTKPTDMSLIDAVLSNEVRNRMQCGWEPGSDAIGEMLNAAMEMADLENMSTLVEKSLLTDGWNFIHATNVKLVSMCCWLLVALERYPFAKIAAITEARNYPASGEVKFTQSVLSDPRVLPYITALVEEVLRVYGCMNTPNIVRESSRDLVLDGHKVPKRSVLVFPMEYHNFHPVLFPDPDTFDPTRFLKKDGATPCNVENIATFGFGPHACPGAGFAKSVIKLFAYIALRNFDFNAAPNQSFEPLSPTVSGEIWHVPTDRLIFSQFSKRQ